MHNRHPEIALPREVTDVLNIGIGHRTEFSHIEYSITNQEQQLLRKGSFRGMEAQLRISNLPDGMYYLQVKEQDTCLEHCFIKRSEANPLPRFR